MVMLGLNHNERQLMLVRTSEYLLLDVMVCSGIIVLQGMHDGVKGCRTFCLVDSSQALGISSKLMKPSSRFCHHQTLILLLLNSVGSLGFGFCKRV